MMQKQTKAALAQNRDELMGFVDGAKFKRAAEGKVYKDFASVIDFIDREDNTLIALDKPAVQSKKVEKLEKIEPRQTTPPIVNHVLEAKSQVSNQASKESAVNLGDEVDGKGKSNYWERKYV